MAVAVVATLVAAALALVLVADVHRAAVPAASSVVVLHEQAPDAFERNQQLAAQQSTRHEQAPDAVDRNQQLAAHQPTYNNQAPDAKDRNEALSHRR